SASGSTTCISGVPFSRTPASSVVPAQNLHRASKLGRIPTAPTGPPNQRPPRVQFPCEARNRGRAQSRIPTRAEPPDAVGRTICYELVPNFGGRGLRTHENFFSRNRGPVRGRYLVGLSAPSSVRLRG